MFIILQNDKKRRIKALRQALRDEFGKRNYRITRSGEVHAYGLMPNSIVAGWWFMGDIAEAEIWLGLVAKHHNYAIAHLAMSNRGIPPLSEAASSPEKNHV